MCKTIRNQFRKKLTFEKLYEASLRVTSSCKKRVEILRFNVDLETNLINLLDRIENGTYKMGKYREFKVWEPKERLIKSLPYADRVVHQWYIEEFIKPYIIPRFINDTYACIENKGTHKAVDKVQYYMRKMQREVGNYYVLKCDIKKFFYSIDKNILFNILSKFIADKELLEFTKVLIFDNTGLIGIPIGNYTSQFFANIYLNELDKYIKFDLKVKYYVRYMDDFILLVDIREKAKELKILIEKFVGENLKLNLNEKSRYFPNKMGINFCGYRIFETHRLLRTSSKKKMKKNVKKWNKDYLNNELDITNAMMSFNSWIAHSNHANTFKLQNDIYNKILFNYLLTSPNNNLDS